MCTVFLNKNEEKKHRKIYDFSWFFLSSFESINIPHVRITASLLLKVPCKHRRRMETETKAKCRRFGMGGKIECHTGYFVV